MLKIKLPRHSLFGFLVCTLHMLTLNGCGSIYFLQKGKITSLGSQRPVSIIKKGEEQRYVAQLHISYHTEGELEYNSGTHTQVNENGVYVVTPKDDIYFIPDTNMNIFEYRGNNITWSVPKFEVQSNIRIPMFNHLSLLGGLAYGKILGENYWRVGVGFNLAKEFQHFVVGMETWFNYGNKEFDIEIVEWYEPNNWAKFYYSVGKENFNDSSLGYTLNTTYPGKSINYFGKIELGTMNFINSSNNDVTEYKYSEDYGLLCFGFYKNLQHNNRMLFGLNSFIYSYTKIPIYLVSSFIQYDIVL